MTSCFFFNSLYIYYIYIYNYYISVFMFLVYCNWPAFASVIINKRIP